MAKKVYLSTYSLRVLDRRVEVLPKTFDGRNDFYDFFKGFMDDLLKNVVKSSNYNEKAALHLGLNAPVITDKDKRIIYGYISSGIGGDKYQVKLAGETKTEFESDPDKHITFRNLFFYLQLPGNMTYGYLIIQKTRDLGAKILLGKALNIYLKGKGYNKFNIQINNMLNGRVYDRMMAGNLKSIDFIKRTIPGTIEELYEKGLKTEKGTLTTTIKATALSDYWKAFVDRLYKGDYRDSTIELMDGLDSVDEIEFELELNGKIKTFHMSARQRTQPDVEVSSDLIFENNEPTTESLVTVSQSLIDDMLTLIPNV